MKTFSAAIEKVENEAAEQLLQQQEVANLYFFLGQGFVELANYGEALKYYRKALVIREKVLGKDHPDTAAAYSNIAGVYYKQGDYGKALEGYEKALAIRTNTSKNSVSF